MREHPRRIGVKSQIYVMHLGLDTKKRSHRSENFHGFIVIPEGFEPPIFWAVTRGIIQLCYGTNKFASP